MFSRILCSVLHTALPSTCLCMPGHNILSNKSFFRITSVVYCLILVKNQYHFMLLPNLNGSWKLYTVRMSIKIFMTYACTASTHNKILMDKVWLQTVACRSLTNHFVFWYLKYGTCMSYWTKFVRILKDCLISNSLTPHLTDWPKNVDAVTIVINAN